MKTDMTEPKGDSVEVIKPEKDASLPDEYLHGTRLVALTVSLLLGMFLVALDNVRILGFLRSEKRADYGLLDYHWHCDPKNHR